MKKISQDNCGKRYIILDSNIVTYFGIKEAADKILKILNNAVRLGYGLAISQQTLFELLNEASLEKEKQIMETLENLKNFYVSKKVLIAAAHLGSLYKDDGIPPDQISVGDKIVAATAILSNSIIFTCDVRDFPSPFFKEVGRDLIIYTRKGNPIYISTAFLTPDFKLIAKHHHKRMKHNPKKSLKLQLDR